MKKGKLTIDIEYDEFPYYNKLDNLTKADEKKIIKWGKKYNFDYLGSGRVFWCEDQKEYFRSAVGVLRTRFGLLIIESTDLKNITFS